MALNRFVKVPRLEYDSEPEDSLETERKPRAPKKPAGNGRKWLPPEDGEAEVTITGIPAFLEVDLDKGSDNDYPEDPHDRDSKEGASADSEEEIRMLPGVKKSSLRRLKTMFGQRSDSIIDLLEMENADGALSLISKSLLQTLVDVLPVVERNVRKSRGARGVYQLNQIISQIREMCHDVQAYKDKSNLGQRIVETTLRPSYLDLAVQFTHAWTELESGARTRMPASDFDTYSRDYLIPLKHNIALYLKQQYEDVSDRVVRSLA